MSLTLDYPYNQKLAKKLSQYQYIWEPMQTNTFIRQRSGGAMYAMPGSSATYPMLDMVSQRIYDKGKPSKGEAIMKVQPSRPSAPKRRGGASKPTQSDVAGEIAQALTGKGMSGGAINWDKVKKVATPILKKAISKGLDVGAPALGAAVGTAIGGPGGASIGGMVGKLGRELIKETTGYGRKPKQSKDVGVYHGGAKPKAKPKAQGGRNKRNEIVKKVMREKGMSLPQASKYVKEHNLY